MSDTNATVSRQAEAVAALRAAAREHKRLSGLHRRRSQELNDQARRLDTPEPEADSHGPSTDPRP